MHPDINRILVSSEQIQDRITELARQIDRDYYAAGAADNDLLLVGILRGAFIFMADLTRHLTIPHTVDFMALSSYGKSSQVGEVRIVMDLREPIHNRHVLIIEDIMDSGRTLSFLYHILAEHRPASLKTCVMVRKQRSALDVKVDYLGFETPDVWLVGYGLDYADHYRTLPYIAELKKEIYTK